MQQGIVLQDGGRYRGLRLLAALLMSVAPWMPSIVQAGWLEGRFGNPVPDQYLFFAIENGTLNEIRDALQAGASPNAADATGRNALAIAVRRERPAAVSLLLRAGARPVSPDPRP